ncbi:MAG: regulatory protein RecX [Deltaproteobacteria bacterium]|nr:regulatory protein RecX [Deltaproteobacteria bacterium]
MVSRDKEERSETDNAFNYCLRLLSIRDRSQYELEIKLKDKEFDPSIANSVISELARLSYIDDEKYACELARLRLKNKKWGKRRISMDLRSRGIDNGIINKALSLIDADDELAAAHEALSKWLKKNRVDRDTLDIKNKTKAYRHLNYRGFSGDIIREVLS